MSVTSLDDRRPHRAGPAICHSCWEAVTIVAPESINAEWKECGKCGEMRVQFCDQPTPVEILYIAELEAEVAKLQGLLATTKQHLSKLREAVLKHLRNSNLASREELRRAAFTNYRGEG